MKPVIASAALLTLMTFTGCVDQYGRIRPPDPIGRAIFNALDPSGPTYATQEYVVTRPAPNGPPPGYYQQRPVAPAGYSDPYYIDGYWAWNRNDYTWVPGRWVQRPRQNVAWVPSRSYYNNNRYYWNSGYWR